MRIEVLCIMPSGGYESAGSVLLPYGADPEWVEHALTLVGVYAPRGYDELVWLDDEGGAIITDASGQPIVLLRNVRDYGRYSPNAVGWREYLKQDPYSGIKVESGKVIHNFMWEESPRQRVCLQLSTTEKFESTHDQLLCWKRARASKSMGEYVTTYELLQIPLNLPPSQVLDMGRWDALTRRQVAAEMNTRPVDLGYQNAYMAAAGGSDDVTLRALFYYWYMEATSMSFVSPTGTPLWHQPWEHGFNTAEALEANYENVFTVGDEDAPSVMQHVRELEPPEVPPVLEVRERAPKYQWTPKQVAAMRRSGLRPGYDFNGRRMRW
jgi:hypothetical protein